MWENWVSSATLVTLVWLLAYAYEQIFLVRAAVKGSAQEAGDKKATQPRSSEKKAFAITKKFVF